MKEIKLNCEIGRKILCATVDETKLEFRNGIALALATITESDQVPYQCYGFINENYEEAFCKDAPYYVRFYRGIVDAIRCGDNDVIVKVILPPDAEIERDHVAYYHIRFMNGFPTLLNKNVGKWQVTSDENLLIVGSTGSQRLYDVSKAEFVTPLLYSIEELEEKQNNESTFSAMALVTPSEENKFEITDFLLFRISPRGNIISEVLSSFDEGVISFFEFKSIQNLIIDRKKVLQYRESQLNTSKPTIASKLNLLFHPRKDGDKNRKEN